jgi:hypothetical protein
LALLSVLIAACTSLRPASDGDSTSLSYTAGHADSLVVRDGKVYAAVGQQVLAISTQGGADTQLLDWKATSYTPQNVTKLITDGSSLYWHEGSGGFGVYKCDLAGGAPNRLVIAPAGGNLGPMIVDASNLLWIQSGTSGPTSQIVKLALSTTTTSTLASGQSGPTSLASDGTNVYWTNADGTVMVAAIDGSKAPTMIATGQGQPSGIVTDGARIYWVNAMPALSLQSTDLSGNDTRSSPLDQFGGTSTLSTVLDGSTLYVAGSDVGWRIGTDGSGERRIFSSYDSITAIAVDDTSLYWTDAELRKMTK